MLSLQDFEIIKPDAASILARRNSGEIYVADFKSNGKGKYISAVIDSTDPYDIKIEVSPKIEIRLTYIFDKKNVIGIQIAKLEKTGDVTKLHLSTLDWEAVLTLLHIFSEMDLAPVAKGSLIIDKGIVQDPESLKKFLNTVAIDKDGREKMKEILDHYSDINKGDINEIAERNRALILFRKLLNNKIEFLKYKNEHKIGKDEEVWQRFFESNRWILGSDCVEILEERPIDEDSITDLPIKDYDGFFNIIELKLPTEDFWTRDNNPIAELTKAIMQCMRYITETDRRMNDHKKLGKLGAIILKPQITLIYGRSKDWDEDKKEQLRIINSSFHNVTILTYDQVFNRAEKIIEHSSNSSTNRVTP